MIYGLEEKLLVCCMNVIPANAGILIYINAALYGKIPAFAGMTRI
jgi:hypothetical protein